MHAAQRDSLGRRMEQFFDAAEATGDGLDDFVLAMENASDAPGAVDDWEYSGEDGRLKLGQQAGQFSGAIKPRQSV